MKSLKKVLLALGLVLGTGIAAQAADQDALTVTIRPNAFYSVDIDTANVGLDLGTVALGASTQTVSPATVTINSTYADTDLRLRGDIDSAASVIWQFDLDTSDQNLDRLAAWATFTDVARTSAPAQGGGYFSGTVPGDPNSDAIAATTRYVGSGGGTTNLFEANGEFAFKDMDALAPSPDPESLSHLWLYFRLPNASTDDDAQNVTITLMAVLPN